MPFEIFSTSVPTSFLDQTPAAPTFTGPFASGQSVAIVLKQLGKLIIMEVPAVAAAAAVAATATASGIIPSALRPLASIFGSVIITSNSVILAAPGKCEVDTSGNIKISADLLGTLNWLSVGGNSGWSRFSLSWTLA